MNPTTAELEDQKNRMVVQSNAMAAALTIAQMDPHSRQDLICYLQALNQAKQVGDAEEEAYLLGAIVEVFSCQTSATGPDLDAWEAESMLVPEGRAAKARLDAETGAFFEKYQQLKARTGLSTVRAIAEAAGLSPTTVHAIEQQRVKPQFRTLAALAKAFGVEVNELTGR
jgi:DNA-binding XRE family transcriptional regulator